MTKRRLLSYLTVWLGMAMLSIFTTTTIASGITKISKEELKSMLGNSDIIILDVDREGNWEDRDRKILGAVRENPKEIESWMTKYPKNNTFILYWTWPFELTSARVARRLMKNGFTKVFVLKGGWKEWAKANYPTEPK